LELLVIKLCIFKINIPLRKSFKYLICNNFLYIINIFSGNSIRSDVERKDDKVTKTTAVESSSSSLSAVKLLDEFLYQLVVRLSYKKISNPIEKGSYGIQTIN
jgi:hypothetical protein